MRLNVLENAMLSARLVPKRLATSGDNPTFSMICPIAQLSDHRISEMDRARRAAD
jgi:hypothetical protein